MCHVEKPTNGFAVSGSAHLYQPHPDRPVTHPEPVGDVAQAHASLLHAQDAIAIKKSACDFGSHGGTRP